MTPMAPLIRRLLVPATLGAMGLAVGFALGRSGAGAGFLGGPPGAQGGRSGDFPDAEGGSIRRSGGFVSALASGSRRGSSSNDTATAEDAASRARAIMLEAPSFQRDLALVQFVSRIPKDQLVDVLNSLQNQTDIVRGAMASHLVLERLAGEDAAAAMGWLKNRPEGIDGYVGINTIFSVWASSDLGKALSNAAEITDPQQRQQAHATILSTVAQRDPLKALDLLDKNPLLSRNGQGRDPSQAAVSALQIPAGIRRQQALGGLMQSWATRDPDAAWAWANGLESPQDRLVALERATSSVMSRNPTFVAEHLSDIPAGRSRSRAITGLAWQWAMQDPDAALKWAQGSLSYQESASAIPQIVAGWSQRDPAAAASYAAAITDPKARDAALNNLIWGWGQHDPSSAANFFAKLPESEQRRHYLSNVARQWASADPRAALDWAVRLSNPSERSSSLSSVLSSWAETDPASAAQSLLSVNDQDARTRAADNLTSTWVRSDPNAAVRWAQALPEGPSRANAYRGLISSWIEHDELAATRWLDQLPDGPSRESAVSTYVDRRISSDPEGAFYWASSLASDKDRRNRMYTAANNWMRRDPEAAKQAILSSSLPDSEKLRLVKKGK